MERTEKKVNLSHKLKGVSKDIFIRIYPKRVTPERFNRGASSGLAWIPDTSIRE
jgi:hypothetical protein